MNRSILAGLMAAALLLAGGAFQAASAQDKKTEKSTKDARATKDSKTARDTKTTAKSGVIEIGKGKDDKFRFFVRDAEGKLLAMSGPGGFATSKDAEEAIAHLREIIARAKVTAQEGK